MKNLPIYFFLLCMSFWANGQNKWGVDVSHSAVQFNVSHLVISEVTGNFKTFDIKVEGSKPDFEEAKIEFSADIASINTDNADRDKHLLSDDFFNAEKFPKMTFKSTSFKKKSGNRYELEGNLTIRDITKKVKFDVIYNGTAVDPWKNTKAGFKISGKINRKEFGLKWSALTEAGGMVVGDEVEIVCRVELIKLQ